MRAATPRPLDTLPDIAEALMAQETVATGAPAPGSLRVVRLRHKPGRGLTAVLRPRVGPEVRLRLDETGASVETGTADTGLPGLAGASAPAPGSELWNALETAARRRLADPGARLSHTSAIVVRHKAGARCVLRYDLTVIPGSGGAPVVVGVFGKLFADPARAVEADALLRALHDEQVAGGLIVVPRPLGVVESLGLALTAAAGDGATMLRPGGAVPTEALVSAARALAVLHRSSVRPQARRTGAREAATVRGRVDLLSGHAPALAPRLRAAGAELAVLLEEADGAAAAPAHGGFKSSQLVFSGAGRVAVTDFDGFCVADPALDVGYFLAYLRPAALWRGGAAARAWFSAAARVFTTEYAAAMTEGGAAPGAVEGTLRRAPLHEAAALLKIAGRRPHRCNAPRTGELAAMLAEIERCAALGRSSADRVPGVQRTGASS